MDSAGSTDPVSLLKDLVARRSVTPEDDGALRQVGDLLADLGFTVEHHMFSAPGTPDVMNLFATMGERGPHLLFAGHTDVVPPGDEAGWRHPPFAGAEDEGFIHGRGTVDMKGGIAAFIAAIARTLEAGPPSGRLSLLITGDEEGPAINGTVKMLQTAIAEGHRFDAALIGEPTSIDRLGDTIKIGRRGSLTGRLTVAGKQGHAAYPHLANNPAPELARVLTALTTLHLDHGSEDFPPSNLEVTSVETGNRATNVIPGAMEATFNIRFNDIWTPETLKERVAEALKAVEATKTSIDWIAPPSRVFVTHEPHLIAPLEAAIRKHTKTEPTLSTGGGTSDGRFIADHCPVVEFGLVGATMHAVDERVAVEDLKTLALIYEDFLRGYFFADQNGAT